MTTKA